MFQSIGKYVGNKAKGRISKRVFQGIETCQIFRKSEHFLYPPPPLGKRHRNISRKTKVLTNINMQVLSERLLSVGQTFQNSQEMHLFCNNNKKNLSPFRDVISMSMIRFSFLAQLGSGIFCLLNAFIWPVTLMTVSLELIYTSSLWKLSK